MSDFSGSRQGLAADATLLQCSHARGLCVAHCVHYTPACTVERPWVDARRGELWKCTVYACLCGAGLSRLFSSDRLCRTVVVLRCAVACCGSDRLCRTVVVLRCAVACCSVLCCAGGYECTRGVLVE
jgi:hypothetical protein